MSRLPESHAKCRSMALRFEPSGFLLRARVPDDQQEEHTHCPDAPRDHAAEGRIVDRPESARRVVGETALTCADERQVAPFPNDQASQKNSCRRSSPALIPYDLRPGGIVGWNVSPPLLTHRTVRISTIGSRRWESHRRALSDDGTRGQPAATRRGASAPIVEAMRETLRPFLTDHGVMMESATRS
jgi:hypothetical protein